MAAGHEMLQACVELGGSLSGEHGIGLDKRDAMSHLFTPETLSLFRRVKEALDPDDLANPDKILPLAGQSRNGRAYLRPPSPPLSEHARLLVEKVKEGAASGASFRIRGVSTRLPDATPEGVVELLTAGMSGLLDLDRRNYTLTVESGISLHVLHRELESQGCHLRLPKAGGTLGGLMATRPWPGIREDLLGMRLLLSNGDVVELGGKVVKNVAGYDLSRFVLGSWGSLGVILEATFKLYAFPLDVPQTVPAPSPPEWNAWARKVRQAFDPDRRFLEHPAGAVRSSR